ncbi:hypothetical protein PIB30_022818 [Stylosanthes scabra]|uniref:Uncharacterized protein n=1 Tax=Stylosanthes scabra TaxID=79078 RepID=A0ABU6U8A3_9FABA|nr:hypothetical protein [Stylosanthes scabra]
MINAMGLFWIRRGFEPFDGFGPTQGRSTMDLGQASPISGTVAPELGRSENSNSSSSVKWQKFRETIPVG